VAKGISIGRLTCINSYIWYLTDLEFAADPIVMVWTANVMITSTHEKIYASAKYLHVT